MEGEANINPILTASGGDFNPAGSESLTKPTARRPNADPTLSMDSENPVVTLKHVAKRTGRSTAAVSYALRDHPRIPEATRREIQQAARELGYRPNPRVSSLMTFIRQKQRRRFGERIAFVWVNTEKEQVARDPFLQAIYAGARQRAQQLGFGLEVFWTRSPGMTDQRLQKIIRARGISGVVLSPVKTDQTVLTLEWDWQHFAAAVIGNVSWSPELHHAGHHHYLAMRMVLLELLKLGLRRPAALLEHHSHFRTKFAWQAAFLTNHPLAPQADSFVRIHDYARPQNARAWLTQCRPDALIVSESALLDTPGVRAVVKARRLPLVTLYWTADEAPEISGVDQCYDRVAAHAVDLVVSQLNSGETGAPALPQMMLFPGRWLAPKLPPAVSGSPRDSR